MHNRIIKQIALAIMSIIVICSIGFVSYNAKADNPNSNYDPSENYNPNTNYAAESTDGGPNGPEIDGIPRSEANYKVEANAYYNMLNDFGIKTPSVPSPMTNTNNNLNNITQTGHGTRSNALWRHGIPREFGTQVAWISKYQHTGYGKDYYTRNVVWPGLNRSDGNQYGMNITPLYYNRNKYLDDSGTDEGPMVAYNPHFNRRRNGAFRIISGNNSVNDDLNEAEYEADLKEDTNYSGYNTGDSTQPYNQIAFDLVKFRDRNHFNMWRAAPYWRNEHLWWKYKFLGTYIRTIYHTWNSLLYAQHHTFRYADGQHVNFNKAQRNSKCIIYPLLQKHNSSANQFSTLLGAVGRAIDPFTPIKALFRKIPTWAAHKVIYASHHWPCKNYVYHIHKATTYANHIFRHVYLGKAAAFITGLLPFSKEPFDIIHHEHNPVLMAKGNILDNTLLNAAVVGEAHTASALAGKAAERANIHELLAIRKIDHKGFMKGALRFIGHKIIEHVKSKIKTHILTKILDRVAFAPNNYYITRNINW